MVGARTADGYVLAENERSGRMPKCENPRKEREKGREGRRSARAVRERVNVSAEETEDVHAQCLPADCIEKGERAELVVG